MQNLTECRWYDKTENGCVTCRLCPRYCNIPSGSVGFCGIRKNINGELYLLAYTHPVAVQVDPIEKKPIAEFMPSSKTFSIGTYGCNLNCLFCQNHHLSRGHYSEREIGGMNYYPEKIVELALSAKCESVAFTYNEPLIWSEYLVDIAKCAKKHDLKTVLVSNAYINREAAEDILPYIDAANFDMKGFSEEFYKKMTSGSLEPVLETIKYFFSLGKHLELTNLVIPAKNDSDEMIKAYLEWVKTELSMNIPLHFSAYFPQYKYMESPPTPPTILYKIKKQANQLGFHHVYLGNIR